MFTLKFYRKDNQHLVVVNAVWFEIFDCENHIEIVVHNTLPSSSGVSFNISANHDLKHHYSECYVENQAGKTIATYKPKKL